MITQNEIKAEIERRAKFVSGKWKDLAGLVLEETPQIKFNIPQMMAVREQDKVKELYLEWGRGTGKTTQMAYGISKLITELPRSVGAMVAPSYKMILTHIIPSLTKALEQLGLYQNLHYFIGRKPPLSWGWDTPYQNPASYSHFVIFYTGAGFHLVSQEKDGDGRGLNLDWAIIDEAAKVNKKKYDLDFEPSIRGSNTAVFKNHQLFCSQLFCSSTPVTSDGMWFVEMEKMVDEKPHEYGFISADARFNLENLVPNYLTKAREKAQELWRFEAEYLNIRPSFIQDAFYGLFNKEQHTYINYDYSHIHTEQTDFDSRGDADVSPDIPLIMGVDWGAVINAMTIFQEGRNEIRLVKDFFVLGAEKKTQTDLINDFIDYYKNHKSKHIYLWYDNTGNMQTGITKETRAELAKKQLNKAGWSVQLMTVGKVNIRHAEKHLVWEALLKGDNKRLPAFKINRENAENTYISMKNAPSVQGRNGEVKKDKKSEKSITIKRQHATDLSDAADVVIHGMFHSKILSSMQMGGGLLFFNK